MKNKLAKYKAKRNFSKTSEPAGKIRVKKNKKLVYVIQKHKATTLHYDLRLEYKGVLKSWAITKIPSKSIKSKRLAIQTEDHPLSYAKFSGKIPKGNYGAGEVSIWDSGKYELIDKNSKKWIINLHGKKLKGKYNLIKTNYTKNSWLFFKGKD